LSRLFLYFSNKLKISLESLLYIQIASSTAHRPIRDVLSGEVLKNAALLPELLAIAFDIKDKNHHKACWISELVFEAKIEWLGDHLDSFCTTLSQFTNESAMRPISKICQFAVQQHQNNPSFLNTDHIDLITEACFDWLINPKTKVATKAYAMRTLFLLGKKQDWIHPELTRILSEDASKHTAAYTAAAKDVLRKIKMHLFLIILQQPISFSKAG